MADYEGVLADLKGRLSALDRERIELDEIVQRMERLVLKSRINPPEAISISDHVAASLRPAKGGHLTMPDAVKRYFKSFSKVEPQTTRQVLEGVRAQGIKGGKNLRGHVYNTLDRLSKEDGPFRRHSDGRWSLREWNLGETTTNQLLLK